jgi:hypothetical protein
MKLGASWMPKQYQIIDAFSVMSGMKRKGVIPAVDFAGHGSKL